MKNGGVCVISGASKGIGEACAKEFAARGWKVYGLSRSGACPEGANGLCCDVTDEKAVEAALKEIRSREENGIDLVIANAGSGISGAAEFTKSEDAHYQFEVNFFGVFYLIKHAIPYLRETKGRALAVSSAAAVFSIPFQSFYSASKSAVSTFVCAVANEVKPFGISAGYLLLGDVKTGFTAARRKSSAGDGGVYAGAIERSVAKMERDEQNGMPPEKVAKSVRRVAEKRRLPLKTTVGASYKLLIFLSRILPLSWQNAIIRKLYT
ncbi:MAG: SDR family NAD(P)-dependent oxidoreductase [Clostridia bacterium]|nr:SDR family NAD(P)-dependent oxidoreductase [Clostridia bacterium]